MSPRGASKTRPPLSVVMPVYNALPYLDEAIESVLGQSFSDFEFVILDDASTDGSSQRLRQWAAKDPRIRLLEGKKNLGPVLSSQRVARAASAPIAARMDADDISKPDRLREQLDVLTRHPEVGVVASLCDIVDTRGRKIRGPELWRLGRRSWSVPFPHGAMMYRKELFDRVGGYRRECELWEDQDLVMRMAAVSEVMVIPRSLYQVRQTPTSVRFKSNQQRQEQALGLMYECFEQLDQRGDYEDVLRSGSSREGKIDPRVFISVGSVILWSGDRPRLFKRLLQRAKLAPDRRTVGAMAWSAWASVSPATLRTFLRLLLAVRNAFAMGRIDDSRPIEWCRPGKPVAAPHGGG